MSSLALLATWMVLAQSVAATPHAGDYAVQLVRPAVVGEPYVVSGWTRFVKMASPTAGQQPKREEESSRVRFELGVKVLEVGPSRQAHRAVLTVRRLTREANGVTEVLFAAGTTIDARLDGSKKVFEVEGKSVEGDAQSALVAAAGLHADDWPTDEEVLGSRQRRGIGESWPINSSAMMRAMGMNAAVDPKGASGSVTLVARRKVREIPCLEYRFKLATLARVNRLKEPPGFKNTVIEMTDAGSLLVPLDSSLPVMEENFTNEVHSRSEDTTKGAAATVELRVRDELHLERGAPRAALVH